MMKQLRSISAVLMLSCAISLGMAACDKDNPIRPPVETVSDYDVYITGTYASMVYVYNTAKKAIIDSIPLGDSLKIYDLAVTGDGSQLLIIKNKMYDDIPEELIVLGVQTRDTVQMNTSFAKSLGKASIEVSHTGQYIAVFDTETLTFLDGNTLQVLYTDTLRVHNGRFLPDDSRFYFSRSGASQGYIDLTQNYACSLFTYTDDYGGSPPIWNIQPAQRGTALYMFASYNPYANWFVSYRQEIDSIGVRYRMGLPCGDLRISPDGRMILASDPGALSLEEPGTQMLIAVNAMTDGVTVIPPGCNQDTTWAVIAGDIVFTPDSRYALVADERGQGFGLLDINTLQYISVEVSPIAGLIMDFVACQKSKR